MHIETSFSSLSHVLMNSAKSEKGITFIESNTSEDFLSYRELYKKAAYVLTKLQEQGLKPGHELVFQFQHNKHFVITFWACILGKIIPVPITFGISDEIMSKLVNVWKLLNHPFLITDLPGFKESIGLLEQDMENREIISNLQGRIIYFDDVNVIYKKAVPISSELNDIAFIQYSSGSTGNPKGVINTHKGIIYNIQVMSDFFRVEDNDKILSWMPLTHDMGLIFFHILPLFNSAQQYLIPPIVFLTYPSLWMTRASDHQITISGSPNFGFRYYLDHFDEKTMYNRSLEHMKYLVNGAEPISFQVCQQFVRTLAKFKLNHNVIRPSYGLAEATLGVSTVPLSEQFSQHLVHRDYLKVGDEVRFVDARDEHAVSFVDLGISLFTSIIITDEAGHQLPEKTVGYIKFKGPCVTPGYYNDPITTVKTINKDGWLDTGDLGFIYNQRLVIVGRAKEIVIINGQNYHPVDLERVAAELEGLREGKIVVTSVFNGKMKTEEILVFIAAFKQYHQDLKEFMPLTTQLRLHFIDKIGIEVHHIIPIKKIPVTTTGKIRRFELKERYLNGEFDEIIEELNSLRQQMKPIKPNLSKSDLQNIVVDICKDVLKLEKISIYDNFFDLGGNSSYALRVRVKLEEAFGKDIDDIALFKYPTINALIDYLSANEPGSQRSTRPGERLEAFIKDRRAIHHRIKRNLTIIGNQDGEKNGENGLEIAVIGMSGRFPGAKNIQEFWENLKNGVEAISFFSDQELMECGIDSQSLKSPDYVKAKGVLEGLDYFDAAFFKYSTAEAEKMEPQMRVLHECSWEALEDAGYQPGIYQGLIGVYVGASPNLYWESASLSTVPGKSSSSQQFIDTQLIDKDFMTTRLSYKLNLKGPSFSMYTACSTSLVAVDLACQGLLIGRCDLALTGGISIWMPPKTGYLYEEGMLFSSDGHNRTFDGQASGTIFSDGAGIVVLKRLGDALANRDHIYAVIKGSATNNDGDRKVGYTAPALEGQAEVIVSAIQTAVVEPESISYVEAHGTATSLGDSIEIDALKLAFQTLQAPQTPGTVHKKYCALGSVKSNLGHLNAAAGIAGLIKTILALNHRLIPPSLHFHRPNHTVDFDSSPFYVNTELKEWKSNGYPLRAGVSSFGIGGTNAHVVIEEPPQIEASPQDREWKIVMLSAKTRTSLDKVVENLVKFLKKNPDVNFADAAYTLQVGRAHFQYRKLAVCRDREDAVEVLASPGLGKVFTADTKGKKPVVIFMFPGQGSQYVDMGLGMYQSEPVFREEMDRCFKIYQSLTDSDIKEILYPGDSVSEVSEMNEESPTVSIRFNRSNMSNKSYNSYKFQINQTAITQPVIFMFEYALAKLLLSWGIKPEAMIGYSFGEYTAACLAGVFSLEDAIRLIVLRGRLMQQMPQGAMLSVPLPAAELEPLLKKGLSIAIDNGPSCIVSGIREAIDEFEKKMKHERYLCVRVSVSHAGHSTVMGPVLAEFEREVRGMELKEPQIPYISNVTGKFITAEEAVDPLYWVKHLKDTVQFGKGINQLLEIQDSVFLEVGPGRDLSVLLRSCKDHDASRRILNLVRFEKEEFPDLYHLLNRLGHLWLYGVEIDWQGFYAHENRHRISLPTYNFEKQYFPIGKIPSTIEWVKEPGDPLQKRENIDDWFYMPVWKRSRPSRRREIFANKGGILLFSDECGLADKIKERFKQQGDQVFTVRAADRYTRLNPGEYAINPTETKDYQAILDELGACGDLPAGILHLWSITPTAARSSPLAVDGDEVEKELDRGFYSLIALFQALANRDIDYNIQVKVVSNNVQDVTGGEVKSPGKAALLGPVNVIKREVSNIDCSMIDIVLPEPGTRQEQELVDLLVQEFKIKIRDKDKMIAFRSGHRWEQVIEPVEMEKPGDAAAGLRENGVYLVIGGLGGIGFILARHLARAVKAKLVLTARSAFPPREDWDHWLSGHNPDDKISLHIGKIRELEALGAEVLVFSADVADFHQMRQVINRAQQQFGKLNGVIHAAGLADGTMIPLRTREMSERILSAKVTGTLVLGRLLQGMHLDFLVFCSSIATVLSLPGQTAYVAANASLDAFAAGTRLDNGLKPVSINWDRWQGIGVAIQAEQEHKTLVGNEMSGGITAEEGIDVFNRILADPMTRVIVSTSDLDSRIQQLNNFDIASFSAESPGVPEEKNQPQTKALHQRPDLSVAYVEPENEIEQMMVQLWQDFLGIEQVGIHDNFFDLGATSLDIIQVNHKLNFMLGTKIPVIKLLTYTTVRSFANYYIEKVKGGGSSGETKKTDRTGAMQRGKESLRQKYRKSRQSRN
jgi:acyl transferase domain-containing protein/acyl-CoA synthetase (AMP-forming)/AMP-acid ligase II/acyl carrier protein